MPQASDYKVVFSSFTLFCPVPHFPGYWYRLSQPDLWSTGTSINYVKYQHKQVVDVCIPSAEALVLPAKGTVDLADWPKCTTIGLVDSLRKVGDEESNFERRYYISSRALSAEQLAVAVRGHWAVENRLHWVLDVSFGEDASTVRKDHAPQNLSLLKKIVLNLIRLDTTDQKKTSLRLKRKAAAWDDDFRVKIMGLIRL